MEKLRFAPIIRVSSEQQKKKGESLKTQEKRIRQYVEIMGGTIPESCWKYKGQESALPDKERKLLDELLSDASKDLFDAVIVCDVSRWSRDNLKSKEGLNILRENGIRFFIGTMESDLYNPTQTLFLGMSAEIGEFQARQQSLISIINRIERAKKGEPASGRLPYGRIWDKETKKWDIDPDKKRIIEQAAKRYLDGEGIPNIAKTYRMNAWNLWKILTKCSGTEWPCSFVNKSANINETVIMTVPRLLDDETIMAIKERIRINTTYTRGNRKYHYMLSGYIFCKRCGYKMQGHHGRKNQLYYRHSPHGECDFNKFVPSTELENSVLIMLVQTFGDPDLIQQSIERAYPDTKKVDALEQEKETLEKEETSITSAKNNLIKLVAEELASKDDIKDNLIGYNNQLAAIKERLTKIERDLNNIPKPKNINALKRWAGKVISDATKNNPKLIFKRTYEWKRKLIEKAFSGVAPDGSRLGVYVDIGDGKRQFTFEIRGKLLNTIKTLPLDDDTLMDAFKIDPEYQDVNKALKDVRLNINSKLHAYYKFSIYQ
jgi:DNA invertase Pin-like site-specific DNA recombinase